MTNFQFFNFLVWLLRIIWSLVIVSLVIFYLFPSYPIFQNIQIVLKWKSQLLGRESMDSKDLIKKINKRTSVKAREIKDVLDAFQQIIGDELANGKTVEILDFGKFSLESHPAEIELTDLEIDNNFDEILELDLSKIVVPRNILAHLPQHVARHFQAVPIDSKNNTVILAMIEPDDQEAIEFIQNRLDKKIKTRACTQAELNHILEQYQDWWKAI